MLALKQFRNVQALSPLGRHLHVTAACSRSKEAGKIKRTRYLTQPVTYEQWYLPHQIGHYKNWNSWNTSTTADGKRPGMTAVEDLFIRKFMEGTWHNLCLSEVIIKRQFNMVRIGALIYQGILPRKMYFLIGYTEEMLSYWLQCPVKLELQTVADKKNTIYKYI